MLLGCPMFHVMCTKQAEDGGREGGGFQNGLKWFHFLPSPGGGTVVGLVQG